MNPAEFESLVSGGIRRIESYGRTAWLGHNSASVTNVNEIPPQTTNSTFMDSSDQSQSPPPLTLKYFIPDSTAEEVGKQQKQDWYSEEHHENGSVFLTDEEYLILGSEDQTTEQERLIFYLEKEDDFPSLVEQCDDLGGCSTSSETTNVSLTPEMLWKNFLSKDKTSSKESTYSTSNDYEQMNSIDYCAIQTDEDISYPLVNTSEIRKDIFGFTSQRGVGNVINCICQISKELNDLRKIMTENNRDKFFPQLQRFCLPVLKYFKRRRCNTL